MQKGFSEIDFKEFFTSIDFLFFIILIIMGIYWLYFSKKTIKEKKNKEKYRKKRIYVFSLFFSIIIIYFFFVYYDIKFFLQLVRWLSTLFFLYIAVSLLEEKILDYYGEEVNTGHIVYHKRGYKVSVFSLIVRIFAFFIALFLFIEILDINSYVQIGGIWAGILAFLGFTAPVWAPDIIASLSMLHSKGVELGDVVYIYEHDTYAWVKKMTLSEVRLVDVSTSNPILYRPSKFRDVVIKNISQGISGKTSSITQSIQLTFDYKIKQEEIEKLCYEAFDSMLENIKESHPDFDFFTEKPYREVFIESFDNYAVRYIVFYSIASPFYVHKGRRLYFEYLLKAQQKYNIWAATADLVDISDSEIVVSK